MLAAGIVQDTFAGEAVELEGGEEEWLLLLLLLLVYFTAQARKSSVSYLLNLNRKTLTRTCVLETDIHIYIYISRVSINMTK